MGLRPRGLALPAVRGSNRENSPRTGGAHYLVVPGMPAGDTLVKPPRLGNQRVRLRPARRHDHVGNGPAGGTRVNGPPLASASAWTARLRDNAMPGHPDATGRARPLAADDTAPAARAEDRAAPLVLLVDDDQQAREGLAELLHAAGYRVSQAADGPEAIGKALRRRPAVVVLDLGIPRVDGWTVLRILKADAGLAPIPVVVLSGLDYPEVRARACEAGCDVFLTKPCQPRHLIEVVATMLGGPRQPSPHAVGQRGAAPRLASATSDRTSSAEPHRSRNRE